MRSVRPFGVSALEVKSEVQDALFYKALLENLMGQIGTLSDGIICESSLLLVFDGLFDLADVEKRVDNFQFEPDQATTIAPIEIPVCYDPELALDRTFLCNKLGMTWDEIVHVHSTTDFRVSMHGFVPGFAYIKGLPDQLALPRKEKPVLRIPAGSVAITEKLTGIYPFDLPGGWHILGRTPIPLFRPESVEPVLLKLGQQVKFRTISLAEFKKYSHD